MEDNVLTNANWKKAVERMAALEGITNCFIGMEMIDQIGIWLIPKPALFWQLMLAVESCKWCPSGYQMVQTRLKS